MPQTRQVGFSARIPELDGLRGIAIALVLYYHCFSRVIGNPLWNSIHALVIPGRGGWTGVDLFFVLSGFLIGGILLDARGATNYFKVFYARRFFRIVPAYVLLLVLYYAICALVSLGGVAQLHWRDAWAVPWYVSLLFLQNFWIAFTTNWYPLPLSILWSLAVEEQFYLTLPWLVKLQNPKRLLHIALEGIALAICFRLLMFKLFGWCTTLVYVLMPGRADALMLGFVGAILWRDETWRERFARNKNLHRALLVIFAVGVPLFTWKYDEPYGHWLFMFGLTWIAFFYFLVLMYGLMHKEGIVSRVLRWKCLGWLGGIAYGVYLFHRLFMATFAGLVLHWNEEAKIKTPWQLALQFVMIGLLLAFCKLLYVFYEKPFLKWGHKVSYEFSQENERKFEESLPAMAD